MPQEQVLTQMLGVAAQRSRCTWYVLVGLVLVVVVLAVLVLAGACWCLLVLAAAWCLLVLAGAGMPGVW